MKIKQLATAFSLMALSFALTTVSGNVFAASHGGAMPMAKGAPVKTADGVLVGAKDMTLYTFDKDADGKSMCNGPCAANWPPLMAGAGDTASGDYSIITRDDGSKQWALKGKPLYYWIKDTKPGDKTGDGFNNVWHVAKP
jgi:predicted lipoprotein with Yx(FWY)xxD motif